MRPVCKKTRYVLLLGSILFVTVLYVTTSKNSTSISKCPQQEIKRTSENGQLTLAQLIANSQSSNVTNNLNSIERHCPMYQEFRYLDFLHPSVKDKLCSNAEAYKRYQDGYPMCLLPNPFDEDMLTVARQGSEVSRLYCNVKPCNGSSVQLRLYKESDLISNAIRKFHVWEPRLVNWILRFALSVPNATFLDIGSNIGVYSILAAKVGLPVVSLDANIRNLLRLHLSLRAASLNADLVWNFIAPGQQLKYLGFLADCNVGGASKNNADLQDTIPVMPLRSDRIASLIKTNNIVMKMDLEGGEAHFLRTSGRLFKNFTVAAVQMEWFNSRISSHDAMYMTDFYRKRGYIVRHFPTLKALTRNFKKWGDIDVVWIHRDFLDNDLSVLHN